MPIRRRLSLKGADRRLHVNDRGEGRHPYLILDSRQFNIWHTMVKYGNPMGGMTAAQIRDMSEDYHPQILADLQKFRLVAKAGKRGTEYLYVADPKGRGRYVQEVIADVQLFEDEHGKFFIQVNIEGKEQTSTPGRIVRHLGNRRVKFVLPNKGEEDDVIDLSKPQPQEEVLLLLAPQK